MSSTPTYLLSCDRSSSVESTPDMSNDAAKIHARSNSKQPRLSRAGLVGRRKASTAAHDGVYLRLYDLSNGFVKTWSPLFLLKKIEGMWHSGVVVYGYEYFYGGGIVKLTPEEVENQYEMTPDQVRYIGPTQLSQREFEAHLLSVRDKFDPEFYDLTRWNCNHFTDYILKVLTGHGAPNFVVNMPSEVESTLVGKILISALKKWSDGEALVHSDDPMHPKNELARSMESMSQEEDLTAGDTKSSHGQSQTIQPVDNNNLSRQRPAASTKHRRSLSKSFRRDDSTPETVADSKREDVSLEDDIELIYHLKEDGCPPEMTKKQSKNHQTKCGAYRRRSKSNKRVPSRAEVNQLELIQEGWMSRSTNENDRYDATRFLIGSPHGLGRPVADTFESPQKRLRKPSRRCLLLPTDQPNNSRNGPITKKHFDVLQQPPGWLLKLDTAFEAPKISPERPENLLPTPPSARHAPKVWPSYNRSPLKPKSPTMTRHRDELTNRKR